MSPSSDYAWSVATESYDWYQRAATRARRLYRLSEMVFLLVSAAIPAAAVLRPGTATIPALLGAVLVVLSGVRNIFHGQENYVRFSRARESVNTEMRRYTAASEPYSDATTRDSALIDAVIRIEQQEMGQWMRVASQRPHTERKSDA